MKNIYLWAFKIQKRDILLLLLAIAIVIVGVISRIGDYEETVASAVSWKVANKVIVIDPGHGGFDPGAVGKTGALEKDIVLEVAQRLKQVLSEAGAIVIMTRESDTDLSVSRNVSAYTRKREDLAKRVALANKNKANIYISLHLNSFPSSRWKGAQTFYQRGQEGGKLLAETIQGEIIRLMENTERQALAEDFYTNRHTNMPAVIVELGFLSNPSEEKLLKQEEYQRRMVTAVYSGIAKYFAGIESRKK